MTLRLQMGGVNARTTSADGVRYLLNLRRMGQILWLLPGLTVMIALFVRPLGLIFRDAVYAPTFTLQNYATLFTEPLYAHVIWNSVRAGLQTTAGCLLLGYPTAYFIFRAAPAVKQIMLGAMLFAFSVGTIPRTFSWLVILGDHGIVNRVYMAISGSASPLPLLYNQAGVVIGMLHVMLPYMVLILFGTMTRVSPTLVPAARTLGASPGSAFRQVFFPLTLPGVIAGGMLIFIYSLGFYITPAVLGGAKETTVVMQIANLALVSGIWELGAALSSVVIVISILGALFYIWVTGLSDVSSRD
jgi:putative spermidine/putrescine transport system permease protein